MQEWYYVKDGEQQGPVRLERLRELAAEGVLGPGNLVWNRTMRDWTPASEIDGIFSSPTVAVESPADPAEPTSLIDIEPGSEPLQIGACLSRGIELTQRHFSTLLLVGIVHVVISMIAALALGGMDHVLGMGEVQASPWANSPELAGKIPPALEAFTQQRQPSIPNQILTQILSVYLGLGLLRICLNLVDGKAIAVEQLFSGGPLLLRGVLATLIYMILVFAGTLLLIVPGIYLAIRFSPYLIAMVDRNLGPIEALGQAATLTRG
ncbi:MAG TPA: DUF4339 domain-containing protein, partial [Luteolibacter sp.]|nr:DUF4339 domain-containing protein [Luteolibacter sp.]